jgi:GNAT superfamily N-acetyltransferase
MIEQLNMSFPGEGDVALIVARVDDGELGEIIGTVCVHRRGPAAEFARVFVREPHRRRGIGRALLDEAAKVARAAGCIALSGSVNPKNLDARRFYARLGFNTAFQWPDGDLLITRPVPPLPVVPAAAAQATPVATSDQVWRGAEL